MAVGRFLRVLMFRVLYALSPCSNDQTLQVTEWQRALECISSE